MKSKLIHLLLFTLISVVAIELPVKAEKICKVTDPTGTPLNVRSRPNGSIINALKNGREVDMLEFAYNEQARPWVRVGGNYRVWGWVIREFVSCYDGYALRYGD